MEFKTPEKLREYKREYMRKRRATPGIRERIRATQNAWYKRTGRSAKQKAYLERFKVERFFKWRARLFNMHYGTKFSEEDLKQIWDKQKGRCHFTGWKLDKTAHLDHIVPIKRGGNHEITNLRWVCKQVNYAKRDMTDKEFLNVIQAIMEKLI